MLGKQVKLAFLAMSLCTALLSVSWSGPAASAAEAQVPTVTSDADTAAELGLLIGDGSGVDSAYLGKMSTRLQAAIISLRLTGQLDEAMAYTGMGTFTDASQVGKDNMAVLAYLKNHPEAGWQGTGGGKFEPGAQINSQQFYKVLLEVLGYKSGTDFTYAMTEQFAAGKGLMQIAGSESVSNAQIATALMEALSASSASGTTLFASLQASGVIAPTAALPQGERIGMGHDSKLGTYFTDSKGMTLYFFTKDAENVNACQGECITNWPIYYSDHLQIPASLNKEDFSVITRTDGTKQITYKNWPLYYFAADKAAGDVKGEAVGKVWFVAKSDYSVMTGTSTELGNYLTDDYGRTLYYFDKDPAGASVCEGTCLANWPAYSTDHNQVPSTLNADDIGMITRTDGTMQTTYKGYPLYYFIQDKEHGDVKGQNVNKVWFVIDPAVFNGTTAAQIPAT